MANEPRRAGPEQRDRPSNRTHNGDASVSDRADRIVRAALLDAMLDGERRFWQRRADVLDQAKPRPGDFHGRADRDDLRARWHELDQAARACRARAHVAPVEHIRQDVRRVLAEYDDRGEWQGVA